MPRKNIIVDTDAGPDDLLALAYLLVNPDITVEAITLTYGLAHAERAAVNISRMVAAFSTGHVPGLHRTFRTPCGQCSLSPNAGAGCPMTSPV